MGLGLEYVRTAFDAGKICGANLDIATKSRTVLVLCAERSVWSRDTGLEKFKLACSEIDLI